MTTCCAARRFNLLTHSLFVCFSVSRPERHFDPNSRQQGVDLFTLDTGFFVVHKNGNHFVVVGVKPADKIMYCLDSLGYDGADAIRRVAQLIDKCYDGRDVEWDQTRTSVLWGSQQGDTTSCGVVACVNAEFMAQQPYTAVEDAVLIGPEHMRHDARSGRLRDRMGLALWTGEPIFFQ
jgi:Ulp1 protease family, C-terminal catalytic domain